MVFPNKLKTQMVSQLVRNKKVWRKINGYIVSSVIIIIAKDAIGLRVNIEDNDGKVYWISFDYETGMCIRIAHYDLVICRNIGFFDRIEELPEEIQKVLEEYFKQYQEET